MPQPLDPQTIYKFIVNDFESAWDGLAARSLEEAPGRGNFMFGWLAVLFLEWVCRLCRSDQTGRALTDFSGALWQVERKYFTPLPGACQTPKGFALPALQGSDPQRPPLLWLIFDLVRNGQVHQYQQIILRLDDRDFYIQLGGVMPGCSLAWITSTGSRFDHLKYCRNEDGELLMKVRPENLFLDVRAAVEGAQLLRRGLFVKALARPTRHYASFTSQQMERSLQAGGHLQPSL